MVTPAVYDTAVHKCTCRSMIGAQCHSTMECSRCHNHTTYQQQSLCSSTTTNNGTLTSGPSGVHHRTTPSIPHPCVRQCNRTQEQQPILTGPTTLHGSKCLSLPEMSGRFDARLTCLFCTRRYSRRSVPPFCEGIQVKKRC